MLSFLKKIKYWLLSLLVIPAALAANELVVSKPAAVQDMASEVPSIGFILDEPDSQPGNIRARLELLTAGGLYADRTIHAVVSDRTHPDNIAVLSEFNVIIEETTERTKQEHEIRMRTKVDRFIHATP
jgi:hypothetical protein